MQGRAPEPPTEPARPFVDPSVLVIGADAALLPPLIERLTQHRIRVDTASVEAALECAVVFAPDLILLVGEAAADSGRPLLQKLTTSPVSSVIPIAVLGDDTALDGRLQVFRFGAAAVIPVSESVDLIADHVARLARTIPEREGDALGEIGEANLGEFVSTLSRELRSGILSVQGSDEETPVRLVLGSGRPLAAFIDDFVSKVRLHVVHAEPLRYEFDDRPGGTVQLLSSETRDSEPPPSRIAGVRLLLADDDSARADVVAQALRDRGASVAVTHLTPTDSELQLLRQLDPEVVIIGEAELSREGFQLLRRLKRDTRLRWASLLIVRWDEMRDPTLSVPTADRLTGPLTALAEVDRGLFDRAELGDAFDTRLEVNGPARCLRALCASGRALKIGIHNPRLTVELDLSDGLVAGALATAPDGRRWEGPAALSALLALSSGRVRVEPGAQPISANFMAPMEAALSLADGELAPIAPSLPVEAPISSRPPPLPTMPGPARVPAELAVEAGSYPSVGRRKVPLRVSKPLAAVLVGLGAVAGLGIAVALRGVTRTEGPASASNEASLAAEHANPSPSPEAEAAAGPAPATAASASATSPGAESAGSGSAAQAGAVGAARLDETGVRVPSCDEILKGVEPVSGDARAAAYDQLKLARKAMISGKLDEAQGFYCVAAHWDPQKPLHHFELAHLLLIRRDGATAAIWAQKGVELDPTSARGQSLLGDSLARIGEVEGARQAWFAAGGLKNPTELKAEQLGQRSLKEAEEALDSRDHVRAERFFRRAALLDAKSPAGPRGLSIALIKLGDARSALVWARRAVERAKTDPVTHLALGDALLAVGDNEGARAAWLEAERLGYPDARRRIVRLDSRADASHESQSQRTAQDPGQPEVPRE